jgi:queuine tRNA-ribosyltransferase
MPAAEGFSFQVLHAAADCGARCGRLRTPHGDVETPVFMPVGTLAAVKGLDVAALHASGSRMLLGNTYHLTLRPGEEVVQQLGGLHAFMGWDGPILTDSGGFQLFSLAQMTKVTEQGASFRSHIDGRLLELTPERAIEIQEALGSDVAMVLDHVIGLPSSREAIADAMERTLRWAVRCRAAQRRQDRALFAIVQGGLELDLREECSRRLADMDFEGYAIGGLSVGETPEQMYEVLRHTTPLLPADKPRYLMGVGRPQDLLEAIGQGIDMFDCVLPTRNGRNAMAFTAAGTLRLRNVCHERDPRPLEEGCPCAACRHSRAYLRHLFMAREMLGPILLSLHNLTYYQRLLTAAREAIREDRFGEFYAETLHNLSHRDI